MSLSYPEILLSFASFLLIYVLRCFYQSSGGAIPTNWPLVGMIPGLAFRNRDFNSWVTACLKEAGGNLLFKGPRFIAMDAFATSDPANINHVLSSNFPNYPKGREFSEVMDTLGGGMTNTDGDPWAFQRRIGVGLMSSPKFRSAMRAASLQKAAKGLLPLLAKIADEDLAVDLCDVLLRFSFDLTFMMLLGVDDPGCLAPHFPDIPFARAMVEIEYICFCRFTVPRFWWKLKRRFGLGVEKRLPPARKIVDDILAQCIENKRVLESNVTSGSSQGEDVSLLCSLMEIGRQDSTITDKFLRDALLAFIVGSRDSTGIVLGWFFWLVSMNPRVEKKILEDLRRLMKPLPARNSTVVLDADEADRLVYLHASICESLRLYPPVPYNFKLVAKNDVLPSGQKVSAGQHVFISSYAIARMEGVWGDDCSEFRPERWMDEKTGKLKREPSHKFLSFHCGPGSCIGKNMTMVTTKMVAAAVMYNFEVEVVQGHVVEPSPSVLLHMKHGLRVRLKKRVWTCL